MKTIKYIVIFPALLILALGLSSCCKKRGGAGLLAIQFEGFDVTTLNSVLLIRTERNNTDDRLDSSYNDLTQIPFITIPVSPDNSENYNYIVKSTTPAFEHRITEINARIRKFSCGRKEFSFKWDGEQYSKKESHSVTLNP